MKDSFSVVWNVTDRGAIVRAGVTVVKEYSVPQLIADLADADQYLTGTSQFTINATVQYHSYRSVPRAAYLVISGDFQTYQSCVAAIANAAVYLAKREQTRPE